MSHRIGLRRIGLRRALLLVAALLAMPLLVAGVGTRPASAATVVNYTVHVPANVQISPCTPGDVVNLNGDIHIVITSTTNRAGSYRMNDLLNSQFSGASIVTGTKYVNSENQNDTWYAKPPFPVVHTTTYSFELVSQSGTPNYVMYMTMHTTVTANGKPTATFDNFRMGCQG
jgi:hypothetical protein